MNFKKDNFYDCMQHELDIQSKQLKELLAEQPKFPKGYLYIRESSRNTLYYQVIRNKNISRQINISDNPPLIKKLARKSAFRKLKTAYENNIRVLTRALKSYRPLTSRSTLPEKLQRVLHEPVFQSRKYTHCPFDPSVHIHETIPGIMVRSKSEAIIANALWHYNIPFHYEEKFFTENGDFFYPDYIILLPDGSKIIWEHLGLLVDRSYCESTAYKLFSYQQSQFVIGKNLIITQDDWQGGCNSLFIYHIIENYILPHFKGYAI